MGVWKEKLKVEEAVEDCKGLDAWCSNLSSQSYGEPVWLTIFTMNNKRSELKIQSKECFRPISSLETEGPVNSTRIIMQRS